MATAVARRLDSITESGGIGAREIAQLLETTHRPFRVGGQGGRRPGRTASTDFSGWNGWPGSSPGCIRPATRGSGWSVRIATSGVRGRSTSSPKTGWMRFSRSSIGSDRQRTPDRRQSPKATAPFVKGSPFICPNREKTTPPEAFRRVGRGASMR